MTDDLQLSPPLAAFLQATVRSFDQLDLLGRMVRDPDRWWDTASVSYELRLTAAAARAALEALASCNLLEISVTTDIRYRLRPGTQELSDQCEAFAEAYRTNPLAVVRFMNDTHRRAVKDFADAFRVRRRDDR